MFEGSYGFFKVMGRKPVEPPQFGEPFGIRRAFTKRFPLGQFSQTVAQAAMEARPFVTSADDIAEVNIRVSHSAIKIMADSPEKWKPQTHETADHSIPYAAGLVLMYGNIAPEYYEDPVSARCTPARSRRPHQGACRRRRPTGTENEFNLCEMEIVLKSGARKAARVEYHRGHFRNPMTDAEMEEKFRLMAQKQLPADRVDKLLGILRGLEKEPQVNGLIAATLA